MINTHSFPPVSLLLETPQTSVSPAPGGLFSSFSLVSEIPDIGNIQIENLKKFCHSLDCSDEENRKAVWGQFIQYAYPSSRVDMRNLNFFSPFIEIWAKDKVQFGRCIDVLSKISERFKGGCLKARAPKMRCTGVGSSRKWLYIPKAIRFRENDHLNRKIPNCAVENVIPPWPTPFGSDYLAILSQLKLLENWGPTLDSLAPSYKASIWRISKIFEEFGTNHDMTSFKKTIARWSQSPLENSDSIRLLFSAIGYLKNAGVLKHEFFYPSKNGEPLYPVFKSNNDTKTMKKKRKRKRNINRPDKDNPVVIDLLLYGPNTEHPLKPQRLRHNIVSAFKPLKQSTDNSRSNLQKQDIKLHNNLENRSNPDSVILHPQKTLNTINNDKEMEEFNAELQYALGLS